jgi:sugar O-acyltransferase (sialic acid O-acetyltransferase NeuD family)
MSEPLLIYGNGQLAELSWARFRRERRFEVVGFTVDREALDGATLCGLPVLPFDEIGQHHPPETVKLFVAVGPVRNNRIRAERHLQARQMGYRFISYVSPHAVIDPETQIGENCSIGDHVVIEYRVRIGDGVRIGSGTVIGHHCELGDHSFVGVNCTVLGSVQIGARVLVGAGAVIRDGVRLGDESIVGIGATIVRDIAPGSVYAAPEAIRLPTSSRRIEL